MTFDDHADQFSSAVHKHLRSFPDVQIVPREEAILEVSAIALQQQSVGIVAVAVTILMPKQAVWPDAWLRSLIPDKVIRELIAGLVSDRHMGTFAMTGSVRALDSLSSESIAIVDTNYLEPERENRRATKKFQQTRR